MPSARCINPLCREYVAQRGDACYDCQTRPRPRSRSRPLRSARAEANRVYDQHHRDQFAKTFYNSVAWKRARALKLATDPVCQLCGLRFAEHVHHEIPLKDCTPEQRTDQANLRSVCAGCHTSIEQERRAEVAAA